MCGRYTVIHNVEAIARRFDVAVPELAIPSSHNVAPTNGVPIVAIEGGRREMLYAQWGLVPFWAKDPEIGARLINARSETLSEKASFKYAFSRRRCLVPSDGFYEWKRDGAVKQPYYIRMKDGGLFAFAGLWETWESPDGSPLFSCAIITVEPNAMMAPIHARMPAILRPEDEHTWLFGSTGDRARSRPHEADPAMMALLRPYPPERMEAYPVSRYVNSPANDGPRCIEPLSMN
jgi:putative SOS response-associated peptidase YedK